MRALPGSRWSARCSSSVRMPGAPSRRALERGRPHPAPGLSRLALLGLVRAIGDRLPGSDHGGPDIRLAGKADGDGTAVTIFLAQPAAKLPALGHGLQEARRRTSAAPR